MEAFLLVVAGVSGIGAEFIRPGMVVPFVAGCVSLSFGIHGLAGMELSSGGLGLIGIASLLFIAEACGPIRFVAGLPGAVSLTWGFCVLVKPPRSLSPALAVPVCLLLGAFATFLIERAKQARRNKSLDERLSKQGTFC